MLTAALLGSAAACRARSGPAANADSGAAETTDAAAPDADAGAGTVLTGEWLQKIDLPDKGFANVTPPLGATSRRPIVVAVHGAGDHPGYMCSAWRSITDGYPFVVCPAGTPVAGGMHSWSSADQLEKRVLEAIEAVEKRWPDHVAIGAPVVYTAFSQGATTAGPLLARHGDRLPRAVLTEGGYHVFEDGQVARSFARAGGQRVVFSCSSGGCAGGFKASVAAVERAGLKAQIDDAGPIGHTIPPQARESLNRRLPFLVEDLRGWEGYATHPRQSAH
jgi:predicted esterase